MTVDVEQADVPPHSPLTEAYIRLSKDPRVWSGDLADALNVVTRTCANVLGVGRVSVWRLKGDQLCCLNLYRQDWQIHEQGETLAVALLPDYFQTLSQHRIIRVTDTLQDPRMRALVEGYLIPLDIRSLLDATLRVGGESVGVLSAEAVGAYRTWQDDEQHFLASVADLVSQLLAIQALRDSEQRYRVLFDGTGDAIFVVREGSFIDCNPAAEAMFGVERSVLLTLNPAALSPPLQADGSASAEKAMVCMQRALSGNTQHFEWLHRRVTGETFDAEVTLSSISLGGAPCLIGTVRDITRRKRAEMALAHSRQQLEFRANHDSLTGLPNRDSLHEYMERLLAATDAADAGIVLMLLDLNRFKEVNDTLGHQVGDRLLKHLATQLDAELRAYGAALYRLGGDEFVVVARGLRSDDAVFELAERITHTLRQPVRLEGISLELGGSLGIACFPAHGDSSHALLRCADVAMYHAKQNGLGPTLYSSAYDAYSPRRLALMTDLGAAIRESQLELHYQPRIDLQTGICTGCEALLRWRHPERGMIPPGEFIPIAEMSELIHPLSLWVLSTALRQVRHWLDKGIGMAVAVNLSARNLVDLTCPGMIRSLLESLNVPAHLLEIEITESALISDPERAMQVLNAFRDLGIAMAIDDFGTGYSSLSYLKRLPIDTLKIDRSFVHNMRQDEGDAIIVRSTIGLAHSFGLKVVAEGVEEAQTLAALADLRCDQAQGYHIARPLPLADFEGWLRQQPGRGHAATIA